MACDNSQFDFSFACYLRSSGYIQTLKTFLTESPHLNGKNVEDFITPNHQVTPAPDRDLLDEAMKLSGIPTDWEKRGSERKKYLCNVPGCTKSYVRNSHLKEYPAPTTSSSTTASTTNTRTAHLRGHAGETPFVCDYPSCSKRFTRSDVLQRHKRTHVQFPKSVGTFRSNESDTVKAPLHAATVILQDQQLNRNANGADANRQMYQNVPADPPPTGSSTLPNEPAINDQHRVINVPSMSSVVISPNGHYSPHSGEFHPPTSSYATL